MSDEQDTFAGYAEREPMLVSELLEDLGVSNASFAEQQAAVRGWLRDGNKSNRMLDMGLKSVGLMPNPYMLLSQVADELGTTREELDEIIESGALKVIRAQQGHQSVVSRAALDAYLRRQRGEAPAVHVRPPLSDEEALAEFLELTGGVSPRDFYAAFKRGEIEDTSENMTLLVKAIALGAIDDRRARLASAADLIAGGGLEIVSPEELGELRRVESEDE